MEQGPLTEWVERTDKIKEALAANAPVIPQSSGSSYRPQIGSLQTNQGYKSGSADVPWVLGANYGALDSPKATYNTSLAKRQMAYFGSTYEDLGFNILRDNEDYYNKNTSAWNDAWRAAKQVPAGMGEMLYSGMRGSALTLSGDIANADKLIEGSSRSFDDRAAIAMSSRGGISQSLINIPYNISVFALPIAAELLVEDALLTAMIPASGGTSTIALGARTVAGTRKAIRGFAHSAQLLKDLKTGEAIRAAYTTARNTAGGALRLGASALVPSTIQGLRGGNALGKLATATTAVNFYRDLRMVGLALDESRIEAASAVHDLEDKLIGNYVAANNGSLPDAETSTAIRDKAYELGRTVYWSNLPVIFATNKLIFPNFFGTKAFQKGTATLVKNSYGSVIAQAAGKKVTSEVVKRQGLFKSMSTGLRGFSSSAKSIGLGKTALKYGAAFGSASGGFARANIMEGLQEVYQEGLAKGLGEYYEKAYADPTYINTTSQVAAAFKGMGEQFTTQAGWEAFLGGFFGAGVIQGVYGAGGRAYNKIYSKVDPQGFEAYMGNKKEQLEKVNTYINKLGEDVSGLLAPEVQNLIVQSKANKAFVQAADMNDTKAFEDIKDEALFSHIEFLASNKKLDPFLEALSNHKTDLTADEKMEMFGTETAEEADNLIDNVIGRAKNIEKRLEYAENTMGYMRPSTDNFAPGTPEYNKQLVKRYAFNMAMREYVFGLSAFDRTSQRLGEIYDTAVNDPVVAGMMNADISPLFNAENSNVNARSSFGSLESTISQKRASEESINNEIKIIKEQIAATDDPQTKKDLQDSLTAKEKQLKDSKTATDLLEDYKNKLDSYLEGGEEATEDPETGQMSLTFEGTKKQDELFASLKNYINHLATKQGQPVEALRLLKLFERLRDYYAVGADNLKYRTAVSVLSDPGNLEQYAQLHEGAINNLLASLKARTKLILKEISFLEDRSQLITELMDIGVYLQPDQIIGLINNERPTEFYSEQDADPNGQTIKDSDTWNKIQEILDNYEFLKGEVDAMIDGEEDQVPPAEGGSATSESAAATPEPQTPVTVEEGERRREEKKKERAAEAAKQAKYQMADLERDLTTAQMDTIKGIALTAGMRPIEYINQTPEGAAMIEKFYAENQANAEKKKKRAAEASKKKEQEDARDIKEQVRSAKDKLSKVSTLDDFDMLDYSLQQGPLEVYEQLDMPTRRKQLEDKLIQQGVIAGKNISKEQQDLAAQVADRNDAKKINDALDKALDGGSVDSLIDISDDDILNDLNC